MSTLESASIDTCTVHHLPGRDLVLTCLGRRTAARVTSPWAWPNSPEAHSRPRTHMHEKRKCSSSSWAGAQSWPGAQELPLEPGVAIFIPSGTEHQIRVEAGEPLRLVTLFSPARRSRRI